MAMQTAATLIPGVVNHRIGRVAGDGGLERIVRTFHARFGSVKMGGAMTARDRLAYVFREGKHKSDAADVESSAGDKEALLRDADRIKASARVRRGPTAERILATQIVELPAESTAEQRKACAEAFVADWKARGHEAVAVVHMHGEEGPQPHLHVEVAARAVDADGGVDRSTALWTGPHGRQAVQAERRRNADLVNRTCDPDPPYHPGNFRDIGIERPAKKRIPPRSFREARTRSREERADLRPTIDEARALGHERRVNRLETALANGAAQMYAVSAEKRAPLHEAHEQHRGKIEAAKAVGAWPPPPLRERLKQLGAIEREAVKKEVGLLEKQRDEAAAAAAKREKELKNAAIATAAGAGEELEARERQRKSAEWRAGELKTQRDAANNRATAAEASVTTLTDEKQQAETRADTAGGRARELEELNKTQTEYVTDWHADREVEPPDLATVEGQSEAWANMRAWEIEERKRRKDEAVAKKAEIEEIARERDEAVQQAAAAGASPELVERAEQAEAERDALATGLGLTPEQVAQAARRAEGELAKAARQAREQAAAALQPHCMPIWRAHLVTSKRLADAVFDEGAEAAEALVRDPDRAGTVLANPDLSGVEELVAAIREADASRPRRTLTLQERAERAESAAAAEAERARAAELERDRAQEAGREARGKLSEMEAALRDVTRQRNDARAALESAGIEVQAAEEAARKQRIAKAQAEEAERERRAEAEDAEWRRLDGLRSRWTRERQAREKYGYKREEMEGKRWSSDADMAHSYKHQFDQEARLIEVIDRKSYVLDDDARDRTEAVAVHDLLYEFAGRRGVDFGHGVVAPAWRIGCDVFLDHARTVAQDENGDRVHVAFPRVAGAPELVYDREQERWDYRHPEAQRSYWMKAEDAAGWEAAARIAHYASVRDALKRSDPVPDKVLADYPDLAPKPQQDKPKTTSPAPEKEQQPVPENDPQKDPPSRKRGGIGD